MFFQTCRNLDFRPPIVLGMIVKYLPVLLNGLLFRVHNCKFIYQDVENLVATENSQKWRESTETLMIQIRTFWR